MKIHRFYVPDTRLEQDFWFKEETILHQWVRVLRFRVGQQIVLFDGIEHDRLYTIVELSAHEAHLRLVTEQSRRVPEREVYLFWSLLKKDKNDWVLQKCTELGVRHFVPIIADRSEKTGFNEERARKIVIEASEQCGRSDIPTIRSAMHLEAAINQYHDKIALYVCEKNEGKNTVIDQQIGLFIGPEGGWTGEEKGLFVSKKIAHMNVHSFTLRAETAAVAAIAQVGVN